MLLLLILILVGSNILCRRNHSGEIELQGLLPQEVNGWTPVEEDRLYDHETIFEYIDGAGEVYRAYGFKRLLARHFAKPGQPDIYADLFDMGDSKNAFGVFTHDPSGDEVGIGQGSAYQGGLLSFWKGRFFVSLFAETETEESREALHQMGRAAASSILEEGERPSLVSQLPEENLEDRKVHYFFNHLILNAHYFVADENILLLDQQSEAVLGRYTAEGQAFMLLLVMYPEAKRAEVAYKSFVNTYMPDGAVQGLIQVEDGRWTAAAYKGRELCIVFDAPTATEAKDLLERVGFPTKSNSGVNL